MKRTGMPEKIKIGISSCLLGEKVRYNGGHKLDRFIRDTLGQFMEFVPVCPEVESGMSVPRGTLQLAGNPRNPRLETIGAGKDYTNPMTLWGGKKLGELEHENLSGYIFKSGSPSCGMKNITVYHENGGCTSNGPGLWARMVMDYFPLLPFEDEGRLHDPELRENFIERIFVLRRWRELCAGGMTTGHLADFHTKHKLLIMSHSPRILRELGKLAASGKKTDRNSLFSAYINRLTMALCLKTTVKKNLNVLYHLMGYFKKNLSPDEKQELLEVFDEYAHEHIPLIVPITLINHYVRKYEQPYLREQYYLNPHPIELKLRTHV